MSDMGQSQDLVAEPEVVPPPRRARLMAMVLFLLGMVVILLPSAWHATGRLCTDVSRGLGVALIASAVLVFTADHTLGSWVIQEVVKRVEQCLNRVVGRTDQHFDRLAESTRVHMSNLDAHLSDATKQLEGRFEQLSALDKSHIRMIYPTREAGYWAMARAVDEADEFVYLMGVSLRDFLGEREACTKALLCAHRERHRRVRILVLDNRSPDALARSNREEGLQSRTVQDQAYKVGPLYLETTRSIAYLDRFYSDAGSNSAHAVRLYRQQSMFLLITDKAAFMMPYHWGDKHLGPERFKLGRFDPLFEFVSGPENGPYEQLRGHFEYVWDQASELAAAPLEQGRAEGTSAADTSRGKTAE